MDLTYFQTHQADVFTDLGLHVELTLLTLVISLAIAIPAGTLVARFPRLYVPVLGLLGIIYTIPSLALVSFLVAAVGIGIKNVLIALVAYAQFILVRNVAVGLRQVDPAVVDAARGMGMSPWQILLQIEYPLALPVVLAGLRIATVATIAIATIGALVDARDLGNLLFDGINNGNNSEIEVGAIAVSLLAIVADLILRLADRLLPATRARATS